MLSSVAFALAVIAGGSYAARRWLLNMPNAPRDRSLFDPRDAELRRLTLAHYTARVDRDRADDFVTPVSSKRSWRQEAQAK